MRDFKESFVVRPQIDIPRKRLCFAFLSLALHLSFEVFMPQSSRRCRDLLVIDAKFLYV